jgi:hypothetical protein
MKKYSVSDFTLGWLVGNFEPSLFKNQNLEVGIKRFNAGDTELAHYQLTAHEITVVIAGKIRLGRDTFVENDVIEVFPLEIADFESLTDSILVCIKYPSLPSDKVVI